MQTIEHKIISPTYGEKYVKIDFPKYVELCKKFRGICIQSTNRKKEGQNPTLYPVVWGKLNGKNVVIQVHRALGLNVPKDFVIDHLNGDTFDNRLSNLEIVSRAENVKRRYLRNKGRL